MTNQDKFIETFGIDAWRQMISFSGIAEQFKEFWTSKYEKPKHTGIDFISDLDKIRNEIKGTLYVDSLIFGELIDFLNGKISADDVIEEFNRVTRLEVLKIIDKYREEVDCHSCKAEHDCYECKKYEESEG